jgi:hypothetical protein
VIRSRAHLRRRSCMNEAQVLVWYYLLVVTCWYSTATLISVFLTYTRLIACHVIRCRFGVRSLMETNYHGRDK